MCVREVRDHVLGTLHGEELVLLTPHQFDGTSILRCTAQRSATYRVSKLLSTFIVAAL